MTTQEPLTPAGKKLRRWLLGEGGPSYANEVFDLILTIEAEAITLGAALEIDRQRTPPYCIEGHPEYVAGCSNCDWRAGVR